jgi:hypothetical protein
MKGSGYGSTAPRISGDSEFLDTPSSSSSSSSSSSQRHDQYYYDTEVGTDQHSPLLSSEINPVIEEVESAATGAGRTESKSSSMKAAIAGSLVFTALLIGVGFVYNDRNNFDVNEVSSLKLASVRPAKQQHAAPVSALEEKKDSLYDICSLNTQAHVKESCPHATTKFLVNGDSDGHWPVGFTWTVLKDNSESHGHEGKTFLHSEKGKFDSAKVKGRNIQCRKFATELCLTGDYIVYAHSGIALFMLMRLLLF